MLSLNDTREPTEKKRFPDGFKFGVATSSYQIEGAWNAADKTPSIWDTFCHKNPSPIKENATADDACKSYEFYKRDVQMLKFLGVDFYRFSVSWPRVLPNGFANQISEDGINYYSDLIDELLANGIEPAITIFHWDLPQTLQDLGGWANPLMAEWFADYSKVLFQHFGDRVKTWITINEMYMIAINGYCLGKSAPGLRISGIAEYIVTKNLLMGHAMTWRLYDKEFRPKQKGVCGVAIAADYRHGASTDPEDIEAGLDALDFEVGMFSHPIFSKEGGFPERVVRRIAQKSKEQGFPRSRLPEFTEEERQLVLGSSDFYGFNLYSMKFYTRKTWKAGKHPVPSYHDDLGADATYLIDVYGFEQGAVPHVTIIPESMRVGLNWVKDTYNNPPVMIFENGFGTSGLNLQDDQRTSYLRRYLNAVLKAIDDGCNVQRFAVWSLMDNFEWDSGYMPKFGLFQVEEGEDKIRKPKASAYFYKRLLETKVLDPDFNPVVQDMSF